MTKSKRAVLAAVFLLLLAGAAAFLFCYDEPGFTGSRIKNPDAYLLDIQRMNGTDLHTLELQAGDVLEIQFEATKGSLFMEIKAPDGTAIYQGNGTATTDFTVNIPKSGVYTVLVEARHAQGTIDIHRKEEES